MKLSQIVSRVALDLSTTQYVLRNPDVLPRMPKAGSQGVHRTFTLDQAFRLAFTVRLISAGIPLKRAVRVVEFADKHVAKVSREYKCAKYKKDPSAALGEWTAIIYDGDFFTLCCGTLGRETFFYEARMQISSWKPTGWQGEYVERYELNLSLLHQRLEDAA